jgi:hypothetical protein
MLKGTKWPKYTKTLSGNSLKGSNIQHKKRQIHAAGEKDAGGDKKLLFFGVYWNSSRHMRCRQEV